jgi:hypothetical protein
VLTHFGSKGWNVWAKDGRGLMTVQTNANLHGPLTHMVSSTSPRVSLCLTQFLGTLMAPQTPPHKLLSTLLGQTQWATWTPKSLHPHCHPQPHPLRSLLWLHQVLMPWAPCQLGAIISLPRDPVDRAENSFPSHHVSTCSNLLIPYISLDRNIHVLPISLKARDECQVCIV